MQLSSKILDAWVVPIYVTSLADGVNITFVKTVI